ncbi:UvrD-helicase domain-containing protein [Chloroflexota bacterium]
MAEVIGFLRENATHGEKKTLQLLKENLPKEYSVYVEIPLHGQRDLRYPDFIILTNFGLIVLEVKDWAYLVGADPTGATIRTRQGQERKVPNPVNSAREYAITLSNELKRKHKDQDDAEAIPWSYAALIANFPYSIITQLQSAWGEEFVWGEDDLIVPDLLRKKLKMIFPAERMRSLTKWELDQIRAIIFPVVEIKAAGREPFVLDTQQERIVAELVRVEEPVPPKKAGKEEQIRRQETLFEEEEVGEELPLRAESISRNMAIRLVRGFSGSGKTLVLTQRARYLAAQYPDWKILVMSFNKPLQEQLSNALLGTDVKVRTFHSICRNLLPEPGGPCNMDEWLDASKFDYPILDAMGLDETEREMRWLQDMGISDLESYQQITRHGIGKDLRMGSEQRKQIFEIYNDYKQFLQENNLWDFGELPLKILESMESGDLEAEKYDVILVDEAQDWAPTWLRIAVNLLNPDYGLLFLVDDPSQSIFRYFSWKEKGVHVVGRTRWLRVPYRNTYEIYKAAYALIADHAEIQTSLSEAGELVRPDLESQEMRHDKKPLFRRCRNTADELSYIRNNLDALRHDGFRDEQIVVLARHRAYLGAIQQALRGCDVGISTLHRFKGLEREVVFIPYLHDTFSRDDEKSETSERRLMYMAMSRARSRLILTYSGRLPKAYSQLREEGLVEFI